MKVSLINENALMPFKLVKDHIIFISYIFLTPDSICLFTVQLMGTKLLNWTTYRLSKKSVICDAWCKIVHFFVQFSCILFEYFLFWFFNGPQEKNLRIFFSLKIKSSEQQNCVNILFLSKSKIFVKLNHRMTENLQNCNEKICNFQF